MGISTDSPKKNIIITFCDAGVGDFVIDNWLASLTANVNLTHVDIAVLDYGLHERQRTRLLSAGVRVIPCKRDGSIVVIRFRDLSDFLKKTSYEQVMTTDGSDVIFQADISTLFERDAQKYRAVCEYYKQPLDEIARSKKNITGDIAEDVGTYLRDRKMVNAGVLLGPREKFIELCDYCYAHVADKNKFGPDQLIVAYFLYKRGFTELEAVYNFILYTAKSSFTIRDGKFFDESGTLIPIVHNAGRFSFVRAIRNFGYGAGHNKVKSVRFYLLRTLFKFQGG